MKKPIVIILIVLILGIVLVWLYTSFIKVSPSYVVGDSNADPNSKVGTCDVCKYGKGITGHKNVQYCSVCDAWICKDCQPNLALRAVAMVNRSFDANKATYRAQNVN